MSHSEAGFEASGRDRDVRKAGMRANEQTLIRSTGTQTGPAFDDLGPFEPWADRGCSLDQVFELIIG